MSIKRLSQEVINKIAAGEIVQQSSSIIKEIIENSLDALASEIGVYTYKGGLEKFEIIDNGKGICKQDFDLICERFATSKLQDLDDLKSIDSFGFRGEALASLSFVSQLQIKSKQRESQCGFTSDFIDGKMMKECKQIGMNDGTVITAYNLFYNLEARRRSFNQLQEQKNIMKLIQKMALQNCQVKFKLVQNEKLVYNSQGDNCKKSIIKQIISCNQDSFIELQIINESIDYNAESFLSLNKQYVLKLMLQKSFKKLSYLLIIDQQNAILQKNAFKLLIKIQIWLTEKFYLFHIE